MTKDQKISKAKSLKLQLENITGKKVKLIQEEVDKDLLNKLEKYSNMLHDISVDLGKLEKKYSQDKKVSSTIKSLASKSFELAVDFSHDHKNLK